jgi:hypothetical protein
MQTLGHLQNPSPSLRVVFEAFPDGPPASTGRPTASLLPRPKRLGNGVVQRAVVRALAAAREPMRVVEIREAVEALLGHAVSYESVSWCLRMGSQGAGPRFERVSYYCYRLRRL